METMFSMEYLNERVRAARAAVAVGVVLLLGYLTEQFTGDIPLTQFLNSQKVGLWGTIAENLYYYLEPTYAVALGVVAVLVVAVVQKNVQRAVAFGMTVACTWLPVVFLKMLFHRPRPLPELLAHPVVTQPADWSFPSGHTAFVTALAMALVLVSTTATGKKITAVLAPILIVLISICVLTMGVHFPTDVLASIIWSVGLAPFMWSLSKRSVTRVCQAGSPRLERFQLGRGQSSSADSERRCLRSQADLHAQIRS